MPTIKLLTKIIAPIERVFDLSRDIDLHKLSSQKTKEEAIAGKTSGLIGLGESVTWRAKHFGIWLTHTSKITEFEQLNYFVDEMTKGAFKSFRHEHRFQEMESITLMTDILEFESPLGFLGRLFNKWVLTNYLRRFLTVRNEVIKAEAERPNSI